MIIKPFDKPKPAGGEALVGWEGEQQVAFYLRRAFEQDDAVLVLNDLRFLVSSDTGDQSADYAQIDHLLIYRCGFILIESKASRNDQGVLHIDARGQWTWRVGTKTFNRPSPLLQVERQSAALRELLNNSDLPRVKLLGGLLAASPHKLSRYCLVAIGDNMRVEGPGSATEKRVMKSEAVVDAAKAEMRRETSGTGIMGLLKPSDDAGVVETTGEQRRAIATYLLQLHVPVGGSHREGRPPMMTSPTPSAAPAASSHAESASHEPVRMSKFSVICCKHCNSEKTRVVYRRDYCVFCDACEKYSAIDPACEVCNERAKVRKDGPVFFRDCAKCRHQVAFWRAHE
jgi:hypothetical protein